MGLFRRKAQMILPVTPRQSEKVRFPWRVDTRDRNSTPRIVDADGKIVAQMMTGTYQDAERIVKASNRAAANRGMEEV